MILLESIPRKGPTIMYLLHYHFDKLTSKKYFFNSDTSGDHTSGGSDHDGVDHGDDYEEVDSYTNHDMVEKAFQVIFFVFLLISYKRSIAAPTM